MNKEILKEFIDDCISTGKCVNNELNLSYTEETEIENAVYKYNDTKARTKIRKILKKKYDL